MCYWTIAEASNSCTGTTFAASATCNAIATVFKSAITVGRFKTVAIGNCEAIPFVVIVFPAKHD